MSTMTLLLIATYSTLLIGYAFIYAPKAMVALCVSFLWLYLCGLVG